MNRTQADKLIRSRITYKQLKEMLLKAYDECNFNTPSKLNELFSRGWAFNIYWKSLSKYDDNSIVNGKQTLWVSNALREFGEYWTGDLPKTKKIKQTITNVSMLHEEPINPRNV